MGRDEEVYEGQPDDVPQHIDGAQDDVTEDDDA